MRIPTRNRRRGAFDVADLIVGIILAAAIPVFTMLVVGLMGVKTTTELGSFQERPKIPDPVPDKEEVDIKLRYYRKVYTDSAAAFLDRARTAEGFQKLEERKWALRGLKTVEAGISELESLIARTDSKSKFSRQLREMADLRSSVAQGIREIESAGQ